MDDYAKLKKSADKVNAENLATWKTHEEEIRTAIAKAAGVQAYLKKALATHQSNAKMAQAEYGGWSKLATGITERQAELAAAKKAKDRAAVAEAEKELKKLMKAAKPYQANISKGVETANTHMTDVRTRIDALEAVPS